MPENGASPAKVAKKSKAGNKDASAAVVASKKPANVPRSRKEAGM